MEKKKNIPGASQDAPTSAPTEENKPFYIVNPAGAVHLCDREHAGRRLTQKGYRLATPEECAELERRNGRQVHDHPIAPIKPPR